jgi:hypothetical protein
VTLTQRGWHRTISTDYLFLVRAHPLLFDHSYKANAMNDYSKAKRGGPSRRDVLTTTVSIAASMSLTGATPAEKQIFMITEKEFMP